MHKQTCIFACAHASAHTHTHTHKAKRTHLSKLLQSRDLQTPSLVISQVEVEFVKLVHSHHLEQPQHGLLAVKVPGHIQMHATVWIPWSILDLDCRQAAPMHQTQQGLDTPESTCRFTGTNMNLLFGGVNTELVGLIAGCQLAVQVDLDLSLGEADRHRGGEWWVHW